MAKTSADTNSSANMTTLEREAYQQIFPHDAKGTAASNEHHQALPANLRQELLGKLAHFSELAPEIQDQKISDRYSQQVSDFVKLVQENIASTGTVREATATRVNEINEILKVISTALREENRPPTLSEIKTRQYFLEERERLQQEFLEKAQIDRDFYYAVCGEILSGYARQLREGRIVQTPSVEKVIDRIVAGLELGETVFVHGDTGGGKSEVSRVAAKRFSGEDPIVVRGYPKMAQEELFGHLSLKSTQALERAADVVDKIASEIESWKSENPGAKATALKAAEKQITEYVLHDRDVSVLDYQLGAQYKAMKEGRVIIYDESNAFPDDLRKKLNDLKTKEPGEWVTIQEDGGQQFQVAKGYGEIETANIGARYGEGERGKGRSSYSPDELDRRQCMIEYGYLPQATKGNFKEVSKIEDKELFVIALAALVDQNGNLVAPRDTLKEIWKFTQFAALTQQAFSGVLSSDHELSQAGSAVKVSTDVLISPRGLQSILNAWRSDGYQYQLGHYVAENLLPRAVKPTQRALLYNLGKITGVFDGDGWPEIPNLESGKVKSFNVESPKHRAEPIQVTSRLEVIEALWGAAPERSDWPRKVSVETVALTDGARIELMKNLQNFSKTLARVQEIASKDSIAE